MPVMDSSCTANSMLWLNTTTGTRLCTTSESKDVKHPTTYYRLPPARALQALDACTLHRSREDGRVLVLPLQKGAAMPHGNLGCVACARSMAWGAPCSPLLLPLPVHLLRPLTSANALLKLLLLLLNTTAAVAAVFLSAPRPQMSATLRIWWR